MTKLYLSEIAPWERKLEYYHTIDISKGVESLNHQFRQASNSFIRNNLENTNSIIASADRIAGYLQEFNDGIDRLNSVFQWGNSDILWQLEQANDTLKSIEKALWNYYDAKALNRKRQGQEAFSYGWIDEAEKFFLQSNDIMPTDFSVHLYLGIIYLFYKNEKSKALKHIDSAIKYAKPKSNYYTSLSLLYKALILFSQGKVKEAESITFNACLIDSDHNEAYYQNAQYNAQLKNSDKAIDNLQRILLKDSFYAAKIDNDELLDPIRSEINELIKKLTVKNNSSSKESITELVKKFKLLKAVATDIDIERDSFIIETENTIADINNYINRNTFLDSVMAKNKITKLNKNITLKLKEIENQINIKIEDYYQKIRRISDRNADNQEDYYWVWGLIFAIIALIVFIKLGIRDYNHWLENKESPPDIGGIFNMLGGPIIWLITTVVGVVISYYLGTLVSLLTYLFGSSKSRRLKRKINLLKKIKSKVS